MTNIEHNIQTIDVGGRPAFVVIPQASWVKIRLALEEAEDLRAYDRAKREMKRSGGRSYPAAIAKKIARGENPVAALRTWRGLSQKQLATKAGLNPQSISHIETGVRKGGIVALRKIAKALDVSLELLSS